MMEGKKEEAWRRLDMSLTRGEMICGDEEHDLAKKVKLDDRRICPAQLDHDIQQIDYLVEKYTESMDGAFREDDLSGLRERRVSYAEALEYLESQETDMDEDEEHLSGCLPMKELPTRIKERK